MSTFGELLEKKILLNTSVKKTLYFSYITAHIPIHMNYSRAMDLKNTFLKQEDTI